MIGKGEFQLGRLAQGLADPERCAADDNVCVIDADLFDIFHNVFRNIHGLFTPLSQPVLAVLFCQQRLEDQEIFP